MRAASPYTVLKCGRDLRPRRPHARPPQPRAPTFPVFALVGMRQRHLRPVAVDDVDAAPRGGGSRRRPLRTRHDRGPRTRARVAREAVRRVAAAIGREPRSTSACPSWATSSSPVICEATMRVPLLSVAQVHILAEASSSRRPTPPPPPDDLVPRTRLRRRDDPRRPARGRPVWAAATCAGGRLDGRARPHDRHRRSDRARLRPGPRPRPARAVDGPHGRARDRRADLGSDRAGRRPSRGGPTLRVWWTLREPDHGCRAARLASRTSRSAARSRGSATSTGSSRLRVAATRMRDHWVHRSPLRAARLARRPAGHRPPHAAPSSRPGTSRSSAKPRRPYRPRLRAGIAATPVAVGQFGSASTDASAVDTARNNGWSGSISVSHVAMRSTPPGAPNSKIASWPSKLTGHSPVNGRARMASKSVVLIAASSAVRTSPGHRAELGGDRVRLVDPPVALDHRRAAARALGALAAARR